MNQNEKPSSNPHSTSSFSTAPELLSQFRVNTYKAMPVPLNAGEVPPQEYDIANINVVGVGPLGSRMVQLLSRNLAGITCHEIIHGVEQKSSGDMAALISSVRSSDLVFILTGFDDEYCESIAKAVGSASCGAKILTLVVAPPADMVQIPQCNDQEENWYNTIFLVSGESLPRQDDAITFGPESLNGYAMRHVVATITNLITHRTGICIDFADITAIMKEGRLGRMGVGVASGDTRGATAAIRAMEQLEAQGVNIPSAVGIIAAVHGSGDISMEDFDAASKVIHEQISPDANIIVGVISDENLGGLVKVTILTVH